MNVNQKESQTSNKTKEPYFFYICGLTGGPYFPIPAIIEQVNENFTSSKNILIGVKNSYEQKIAQTQSLLIEYLPKVKLDLLSFKNAKFYDIIIDILKMVLNIFKFGYSIIKCIYLLLKYRPLMIYSTGSFLAVPMIWSSFLLNKLRLTQTKIIIHQQDASPGLANKLTSRFADILSCTFQFTKDNYPKFIDAELIPNPIIESKYSKNNLWKDKILESFVKEKSDKPLLMVFGGGTGALAINNWVWSNCENLLNKFRVIHLTGSLQTQKEIQISNPNYYSCQAVFDDMPTLLAYSDLVICRAGLGSISELSFLGKPTFLVPIPDTHQVQNAELISNTNPNFRILNQKETDLWIENISDFKSAEAEISTKFERDRLLKYYQKLFGILG